VSRNFVAGEAKIARSETAPESLQEKNRGRTESGIPISSVLGPAPVKPDWSLVCWPQKGAENAKILPRIAFAFSAPFCGQFPNRIPVSNPPDLILWRLFIPAGMRL
jgi:hypothetical protein